MSMPTSKTDKARQLRAAERQADDSDARRDGAFTRIRTAILKEQFAAIGANEEKTGNDPYNSGVHRALTKSHTWDKRSR